MSFNIIGRGVSILVSTETKTKGGIEIPRSNKKRKQIIVFILSTLFNTGSSKMPVTIDANHATHVSKLKLNVSKVIHGKNQICCLVS